MKVLIRSIILLLMLTPLAFSAEENVKTREKRTRRAKHVQPLREIDRPLTLPQRNVQLSAGYMGGFTWDKDSGVVDKQYTYFSFNGSGGSTPYHWVEKPLLFCPDFTYAFNDSLEISTRWLMPTLTYTFLNNSTVDENKVVTISKPTLAVFAGLEFLRYNNLGEGNLEFAINGGIKAKFPINKVLWSDAMIKVAAGNTSEVNVDYDIGFGIQLNDYLALKPKVNLEHIIDYSREFSELYPTFETEFDINFSRYIGLDIYGLVSESNYASINCSVGATLNFNW